MSEESIGSNRKKPPPSVRDEVLREAGYMCANPCCRHILTLELHHIVWVKDGGGNDPTNLIALCANCHALHTKGHIPRSAIRHWKGMLHALNHAFNKENMDLLLFLNHPGTDKIWYSGDGVLRFAALIAAGLAKVTGSTYVNVAGIPGPGPSSSHHVILTEKGKALLGAWLAGDEAQYRTVLSSSNSKG